MIISQMSALRPREAKGLAQVTQTGCMWAKQVSPNFSDSDREKSPLLRGYRKPTFTTPLQTCPPTCLSSVHIVGPSFLMTSVLYPSFPRSSQQ